MFEIELLEYNKILNKIQNYSFLDETKKRIIDLRPTNDKEVIFKSLGEVSDAKNFIFRNSYVEIVKYSIKDIIDRIRIGASLTISEINEILSLSITSSKYISYYKKIKNLGVEISSLDIYFDNILSLKPIENEIRKIIDDDLNIIDTASNELYKIRKNIRQVEANINSKLSDLLKSLSSKLSEAIITIRNGHKVIPIKSEYKSHVKGIIYDESQSGQTVYIEPLQISELENKITSLKNEENKEIDRILYELSVFISSYYDAIKNNDLNIKELDFIFSKARYAKEIDAVNVVESNVIDLIDARHPLIDKDEVVANDISLDEKRTMIITGPNTGGKTVVLKTLGLLSLMVQSGILIPVKEGSKTVIFSGIYADIGDEQSIEQSLSTFSSHMTRIVRIINSIENDSLVLLDELGSGTDPKEGASLAISILNYLRRRNIYSVSTTHYPELKEYAYQNSDILNASVEFDNESLKPTYKLLINVSGSSNALLISEKLGLNKEIIDEAKNINLEFRDEESNLIKRLEEENLKVKQLKQDYLTLKTKLENDIKNNEIYFKAERNKLYKRLDVLTEEKNKLLEKTQKEATILLDEIKKVKKEIESGNKVKEDVIASLRGKTNSLYKDKYIIKSKNKNEIKVGDSVRIIEYDRIGTVLSINKNKYTILLGSLNSTFSKNEIEYVDVINQEEKAIKDIRGESTINNTVSTRLDLRGFRYEEAKEALEKFIDDALISNLNVVEIIHGYGTLALRNMVIDYCKSHDQIKSYRPGDENEGGRGVTICYLK